MWVEEAREIKAFSTISLPEESIPVHKHHREELRVFLKSRCLCKVKKPSQKEVNLVMIRSYIWEDISRESGQSGRVCV